MMSVLIIRVAMTTWVFQSTPVAFVVVQGDEEPGDKTPRASVGVTTPTQNGSRRASGVPECVSFLFLKDSLPSDKDEKCRGAFWPSQNPRL